MRHLKVSAAGNDLRVARAQRRCLLAASAQAHRSFQADRRLAPENHLFTEKYYMPGSVAASWVPRASLFKATGHEI